MAGEARTASHGMGHGAHFGAGRVPKGVGKVTARNQKAPVRCDGVTAIW